MIVYRATSRTSGKSYVGLTARTLQQRIREHRSAADKGVDQVFYRAMRKYGPDDFDWEILCELDPAEGSEVLDEAERQFIAAYGTYGPGGYNMTRGGDGVKGLVHTEDAKRRMSEKRKGELNPNFGKLWGKSKTGWTEEERKETSKKRMGDGNPMAGKHHSEEAKRKIGNAHYKRVVQCDDAGREIRVFNSVVEAATCLMEDERLIVSMRNGISRACRFPTRRAGGFFWRYVDA